MSTCDFGYGTVHQRRSDGRWLAAVDLPRGRGEKRRRKVFTGPTREVVEAKLHAYREAHPATPHLGREGNYAQARAQGTHTDGEWWALVRASDCRCYYCGATCHIVFRDGSRGTLEKDHKIPVSRGGSDSIENIVVACHDCNTEKGTMTEAEYRAWKTRP